MNINPLSGNNILGSQILSSKTTEGEKDFAAALEQAKTSKDDQKLKEACQEIETYMLTSIFKQMKQSTETEDSLIPKGDYEKMFEDQMLQNQCKNLTKAGGIGLADMMYKQMVPQAGKTTDIKL